MTREQILEGMVISLIMTMDKMKNPEADKQGEAHVLRTAFDKKYLESVTEKYQVNVSRAEPNCVFMAKDEVGLKRFPGNVMPGREN